MFQGDSITDTNRVDGNEDGFGLGCGYPLPVSAELAKAAKRVAEKYGLCFVELQNKFNEACADGGTRYRSVDGVHPTAAGHQIIKEELTKAILNIVQ